MQIRLMNSTVIATNPITGYFDSVGYVVCKGRYFESGNLNREEIRDE